MAAAKKTTFSLLFCGSCRYCYGVTCCKISVCFLFFFYPVFSFHAEHLTEVDLEEKRESQEKIAMQEFDQGNGKATTVPQLLEKLSKPGQMPFYYCGGLMILSQALTDCECSFARGFPQ